MKKTANVHERIIYSLQGERSLPVSDGIDKSGDSVVKQRPRDRKVNSTLLEADGGYKNSGGGDGEDM